MGFPVPWSGAIIRASRRTLIIGGLKNETVKPKSTGVWGLGGRNYSPDRFESLHWDKCLREEYYPRRPPLSARGRARAGLKTAGLLARRYCSPCLERRGSAPD